MKNVFLEGLVISDRIHELHGDYLLALGNNLAARAAWEKALKAPAEIFQPSRKESIRKKLLQ
ncbi:MAG: hypothetical protein VX705_01125 [Verrucomicrobiota bacterium]|nr:hypothetical protein [Verrucomicrobiota bacterium]